MAVISIQVCSLGIQGMGSRIAGGGGLKPSRSRRSRNVALPLAQIVRKLLARQTG